MYLIPLLEKRLKVIYDQNKLIKIVGKQNRIKEKGERRYVITRC